MIFVVLNESANKRELMLVDGGLCRYGIRQDDTIHVHEIIVLPSHRRKGVAKKMIDRLREENPGMDIHAECPVDYESNKFWEGIGCVKVAVIKPQKGPKRNHWVLIGEGEKPEVTPRRSEFVMAGRKDRRNGRK